MHKLVWRNPQVFMLLQSPVGTVGRDLTRRARRVEAAAKRQVGVKTGKLKQSIKIADRRVTSTGQKIKVGSDLQEYALIHHEGSRPHVILPVRAKQLVFSSNGRIIRTNRVNHPGTKPNKYLTDNLPLAL